jgi:hypothetical protein
MVVWLYVYWAAIMFWICELILKNLELILVFLVFLVIVYFYLFLINLWEEVVRIKLQVYSWFIRVRAKFFEKKLKKSCYDQKIAQNKDKNHFEIHFLENLLSTRRRRELRMNIVNGKMKDYDNFVSLYKSTRLRHGLVVTCWQFFNIALHYIG